jgi:predicted DNA-binding transcriptional regulator YafY
LTEGATQTQCHPDVRFGFGGPRGPGYAVVRRTERLFAIAEYLRGRRTGVTAGALAERFDVTLRTIYRDLDSLREAELPVASERGRGGGFALERSYSLPPVNLSAREAAVLLVVAEWAREHRVVPFVGTLDSATDKVRSALSVSSQRQLLEHLKTLMFVGVPARSVRPAVRRAVEQAWFEGCPLALSYTDSDGVAVKCRVRLRTIVMDRGETRLNTTDLDHERDRQLRLDRIESAEVLRPEVSRGG